jgi:hypothetical protein
MAGLLEAARDVDFELPELQAELLQFLSLQVLFGKAKYPVLPQSLHDFFQIARGQRLREIQARDGGAQGFAGRREFHYIILLMHCNHPPRRKTRAPAS